MIGRMYSLIKNRAADGKLRPSDEKIGQRAIDLHASACLRAKDATFCWMLCAKRLGLYKDVSCLIGRLVWERRDAFTCMSNEY